MKSLTSLWSCIANEMAIRCCTSATLDIKYVERRFKHEGLWFLAVTLADFGKAIQKWLDQGFVVPSDTPSFARGAGRRNGIPKFLSGFLGRVFEPSSGVLLEEPDIEAIYALRQLTLMFGKIALPKDLDRGPNQPGHRKVVSADRERRAMEDFLQCEHDVKASDARLGSWNYQDLQRVSGMLFGDMFAKVDRDIHWNRHLPKHGPGAVADRLPSNQKWNQRNWPARLEGTFPAELFLTPNLHFWGDVEKELNVIEPGAEQPVRVISVPKTLKTPRIIAIEPTAMQYAQQAVLRSIREGLREDGFLTSLIGIDDQTPNQRLAAEGSLSGDLATLDLSEASDRVSNQHVLAMMEDYPQLSEAVQASRSRKADVPGHGVIRLAKFASMGSALCFPVEAMVFATVIFIGIEQELGTPLTPEVIKTFQGRVRVFGDDLIVPREYVLSVVDNLELFGFKVNVSKSYWTGRFRESCGKEYYSGQDVSIVRVREVLPTRRLDASGVISTVSLRNQLYWAGLWKGAAWLDNYLRKLIKVFPNVAPTSPLLGRESVLGYEFQKLTRDTMSPLTKGYMHRAVSPIDELDGIGALHKCLSMKPQWMGFALERTSVYQDSIVDAANIDDEHLERSGRPEHVSIKLGWGRPF